MKIVYVILSIIVIVVGVMLIKPKATVQAATKSVIDTNYFDKRKCIESTFLSQVGVHEEGKNSGKQVEIYLKTTGLSKGYPWCGAFVYWTYKQCSNDFKITSPALAASWFKKDKIIYLRGKINKQQPQTGDVLGFYYPEKNRISHVGFYWKEDSKFYYTVEGNTSSTLTNEGDGVYKLKRIKRTVYAISSYINN